MNLLGKLTWSAIPFDQPIVMAATGGMVASRGPHPWVDHAQGTLALSLARVDHIRRPQAHRCHVLRVGANHAAARLRRRDHDALATGDGRRRSARILAAGAFRSGFLGARHDHDLLHGDAIRHWTDELCGAAAAWRPGHGLSDVEFRCVGADGIGHTFNERLLGGRRVRKDRLGRLSTAERAAVFARRRCRLLSLGAANLRHRHVADRNKFRHDDLENARARNGLHAHAGLLLDGARHRTCSWLRPFRF